MIVFGTRGKESSSTNIPELRCTSCGNSGLNASTVFRYFHIYWIPMFPTSRKLITTCPHCQHAVVGQDDASKDRFAASAQSRIAPYPAYLFIGLLLLAALGGYIVYDEQQSAAKSISYLETPAVNDLFVVKLVTPIVQGKTRLDYGVLKLVKQDEAGLHFTQSNLAFRYASDVTLSALSKGEYDGEETVLAAEDLKVMNEVGKLPRVIRPGE